MPPTIRGIVLMLRSIGLLACEASLPPEGKHISGSSPHQDHWYRGFKAQHSLFPAGLEVQADREAEVSGSGPPRHLKDQGILIRAFSEVQEGLQRGQGFIGHYDQGWRR